MRSSFLIFLAVSLAACSSAPVTSQPVTAVVLPSAVPLPSPTSTLAAGAFTDPVFDQDFPDPDVLKVGDTYYAYATNSGSINIQEIHSTDLVHWEGLTDALPRLPSWAEQSFGWAWAPEVTTSGKGYIMYFVAHFKIKLGGTQCIGAATSDTPQGPFTPSSSQPLICQTGEGGSIDPSSFVDEDGQHYILWKNDGNSQGGVSWLYIQKVSDDGLTLSGEPQRLITADQAWEGILVEAPTLWKHGGKYYLFYSANIYNTPRYAVGYAVAEDIFGPYTKPEDPLLKLDLKAGLVGPGGQDIVVGPHGGEWIIFHGWSGQSYRRLYLAPLSWENGVPSVKIDDHKAMEMP